MCLRTLSDDQLLLNTETLVQQEREILADVLRHIREVDARKLYAREKFSSLFQFCTERLKYSPDQAQRRIVAARLLDEIPEIEEKVADGRLTLSHLNLAARAFKVERVREVRLDIVTQIEATSLREAERRVAEYVPLAKPVDKVRVINESTVEVKFAASIKFEEKLKLLKGRLAHRLPDASMAQILEAALDMALEKTDPSREPRHKSSPRQKSLVHQKSHAAPKVNRALASKGRRQAIPRSIKRVVFRQAQNRCENCGSQHKLEIDHRKPCAYGGTNAPENLRVLCRPCNVRAAIEVGLIEKKAYQNRDQTQR